MIPHSLRAPRFTQRGALASLTLGVAAAILTTSAAGADDWPQFRRDGVRSGYTRDSLPTGMVELWEWEDSSRASAGINVKLAVSSRAVGACAIWNGRIFVISNENKVPHLVCADARTGLRLWQQRLNGWPAARLECGPAVTRSGIVYAYDLVPMTEKQVHVSEDSLGRERDPAKRKKLHVFKDFPATHLRLRAFHALTGRPLAEHPLPAAWPRRQLNPLVTRLFLGQSPAVFGGVLALLPAQSTHWGLWEANRLGPPLIIGDRMTVTSGCDMAAHWRAGAPAEIIRLCYPVGSGYLDLHPGAVLQGFPPAQVGGDALVADDQGHRFFGLLGTGPRWETFNSNNPLEGRPSAGSTMKWHRDSDWTLGLPTVASDVLAMGLGGQSATSAIAAFEAENGAPRWVYPALPPAEGSQRMYDRWVAPIIGGRVVSPDEGFGGTWSYVPRAGPFPPPPNRRIRNDRDDWEIFPGRVISRSGNLGNPSLVSSGEEIYGIAGGSIVALKSATGTLIWKRRVPPGSVVTALLGSRDHLVVCQHNGPRALPELLGFKRDTGKLDWSTPIPATGQLVSAYSLLALCEDGRLRLHAPAERTFRMAVESDNRDDYLADTLRDVAGDGPPRTEPEPALTPEPSNTPGETAPNAKGLADCALLRLQWGEPLPEMMRRARQRRRAEPDGRILVSLDWLNRDRSSRLHAEGAGGWSGREIQRFAAACAQIADAVRPQHFEIASEVDVYLARNPDALESVRSLIRATRRAVKQTSPDTRVVISFNCEVLGGFYGRTRYFPFGELPELTGAARSRISSLADEVEVVGLTTRPQAGFIQAGQMGPNYFLARRAALGDKPVIITRMEARWDHTDSASVAQTRFLKRLFQLTYWLNAQVVAYPDLTESTGAAAADVRLRNGAMGRPAMAEWKSVLGWCHVEELTAAPPSPQISVE